MSKTTIVTLCLTCKRQYEEAGFTVKTYPGPPTTKKKTKCEQCRRSFGLGCLSQYVVTAKGGKR